MSTAQLFFFYFAFMITVSSVLVITRKNPIHSVLCMLIMFVHIAGLYLFLNAEFLAAIQIIVYAGAILVLYLFVIMLLNLRDEEIGRRFQKQWPLGLTAGLIFLGCIVPVFGGRMALPPPGGYSVEFVQSEGIMMTVGKVLYTQYLFPFEIASVILLVAILGAVVMAKKKII